MNLSPHFTLEEMIRSESAIRHGIDNTPNQTQTKNLQNLCVNVLESLRLLVGKPINVTSGFRNPTVNSLIGGSLTSQHMKGEAADISVEGLTTEELFVLILSSTLPFDQVIQEFNSWVHISHKKTNRHEALRATKNAQNKTIYTKV
jgi:zinc D-Ala-D-Ala carboxypeptidase